YIRREDSRMSLGVIVAKDNASRRAKAARETRFEARHVGQLNAEANRSVEAITNPAIDREVRFAIRRRHTHTGVRDGAALCEHDGRAQEQQEQERDSENT